MKEKLEVIAIEIAPAPRPVPARLMSILRALWNAVPPVACKGLCQSSCQNVPIMPLEAMFLIERHGARVELAEHLGILFPTLGRNAPCQFLDAAGRCSIYEDRPLVCRQFGHDVVTLGCKHGCAPDPATFSKYQFLISTASVALMGMTGRTFHNTGPREMWYLLERQIADLELIAVLNDGTRAAAVATYEFDPDSPDEVPGRAWEEEG